MNRPYDRATLPKSSTFPLALTDPWLIEYSSSPPLTDVTSTAVTSRASDLHFCCRTTFVVLSLRYPAKIDAVRITAVDPCCMAFKFSGLTVSTLNRPREYFPKSAARDLCALMQKTNGATLSAAFR